MKKKLKVLLLHNIISPYRQPLFEEISKQVDLQVYFGRATDKTRKWSTNLKNYTFKYKILPSFILGPFFINYTILFDLLFHPYDVYIFAEDHEITFSVLAGLIIAKIYRKPCIIWTGITSKEINLYPDLSNSGSFLSKLLYKTLQVLTDICHRLIYHFGDVFISYSSKTSQFLHSYNIPDNKIYEGTQVMPEQLLIKPKLFKKESKFRDKKVVLYLGYIKKVKGIQYLVNAFKELKIKNTVLLIVGDGPMKKYLKQISNSHNNIYFIDNAEGIEKANYFSCADIFVLPTLFDVWGLVINEALYYGVPIITTSAACASELIRNGKEGFVVKPANAEEIKISLDKLLKNDKLLSSMKATIAKFPKEKITSPGYVSDKFLQAIDAAIMPGIQKI